MAPLVRSWTRMPFPLRATAAAAALVAAPLALAPASPARHEPPALAARLLACGTGPQDAGRFAVFRGSMPRRAGAERLWMRFDLEHRVDEDTAWQRLRAATFGRWERSEAGVPGFVYTKRVEGLAVPAAYRAVVRFRWVAANGTVIRASRRVTRACVQRDDRPDLAIHAPRLAPDRRMAEVTVRNAGRTATGPGAALVVTVDGAPLPRRDLEPLGPGDEVAMTFPLPAGCPAGTVIAAIVDPEDVVEEASESDNRRVTTCS